MHRFFVEQENLQSDSAEIMGEDAQHIGRVLRHRPGDTILVCNGAGQEARGRIVSLERDRVCIVLEETLREAGGEPKTAVTLYQCLPKQGKLEWIVQKCVELGVSHIVPVASARCVTKPEGTDAARRLQRYQRVAYEAAKQSQRGRIPTVGSLMPLWKIQPALHDLMLVAYEEETVPLKEVLRQYAQAKNIGLLIGPEGGLEPSEVEKLTRQGGVRISLGSRILRTETAGMAALSMILYELEG